MKDKYSKLYLLGFLAVFYLPTTWILTMMGGWLIDHVLTWEPGTTAKIVYVLFVLYGIDDIHHQKRSKR